MPSRPTTDIPGLTGQPSGLPGGHRPKRRLLPSFDPYDLPSAFSRLKQLLGRDADGVPRTGVPNRGFYLNILV